VPRKSTALARIPISLRLPAAIVGEVDAFAESSDLRRTDAFLHFLRLGIETEQRDQRDDRLSEVEEKLDQLLELVRGAGERSNGDVLSSVRDAVSAAASQFPAINRAYLFGSIARGTATAESDIDLRLIVDRNRKFNLHDLEHFCKLVERETGRAVDVVTSQIIKNEELAAAIERDKVLVYEREAD